MEERLLLEILKTLERGNSCGRDTVKNEILSMQSFSLLTDAEYVAAWNKLIENKCVIDFRNQQKNNVREYKLNPTKDCIPTYTQKLIEKEQQVNSTMQRSDLEQKIKEMTLEQLEYEKTIRGLKKDLMEAQRNDIPKAAQHRDDVLIWQIIAGVSVTVAFLLKLFGVKGWL
ncbi:MAG: hypothetical protein JNK27_06995 [Chitinophagaceae bacterium]|nr:hypothetical protein [Chitinophagaceae bacterium]